MVTNTQLNYCHACMQWEDPADAYCHVGSVTAAEVPTGMEAAPDPTVVASENGQPITANSIQLEIKEHNSIPDYLATLNAFEQFIYGCLKNKNFGALEHIRDEIDYFIKDFSPGYHQSLDAILRQACAEAANYIEGYELSEYIVSETIYEDTLMDLFFNMAQQLLGKTASDPMTVSDYIFLAKQVTAISPCPKGHVPTETQKDAYYAFLNYLNQQIHAAL